MLLHLISILLDLNTLNMQNFKGHVADAYKFVQFLQFEQIAKAVPVIISIDKKQDIMIGKQDTSIGILSDVRDDTCAIKDDISVLRKDTSESISEK